MAEPTPAAPPISAALLEWLSVLFPDKAPVGTERTREVWLAAGAQRVLRKLRATADSQSENVLEDIV